MLNICGWNVLIDDIALCTGSVAYLRGLALRTVSANETKTYKFPKILKSCEGIFPATVTWIHSLWKYRNEWWVH